MGTKPSELTRDMWTYKGWQIGFDMPPIPTNAFDWCATSPDYDVDCDGDGYFRSAGQQVHAATYEDLLQEIEDAIADGDDA
ncbi:hypothetical protein [Novosphingobium sp. MMS21-SN21R]|uniref:hypothetical protein n=1 Tax=Novosphingobium sp. MMS21-SN21R TaxID=2969298 RepID=UPI00288808A9|nr:hypothetical protein [Novosphingobium sp. MMS21-SN21R]MDT0507510.1 hypothetical protein [Novosphingobium sp. MMS21-SN21R]